MFIYLLSQNDNTGYDTYDYVVVVASSEHEAKRLHPSGDCYKYCESREGWYRVPPEGSVSTPTSPDDSWADTLQGVAITKIGDACPSAKAGVVCASFNAG